MFLKPHKMCLVPDFFLLPLTHLKFSIHSHYSQEKPIAGQPEYQGLYSSLFGVVIIRSVDIFIDASKLVKKVFPISDYKLIAKYSKMLKDVSTHHLCKASQWLLFRLQHHYVGHICTCHSAEID